MGIPGRLEQARMVLPWLIQEWIARWLGLRGRLRDRGEPDAWWLAVRERILRFLVSRYADTGQTPQEERTESQSPPPLPLEARRTFCRVKPEDNPPRTCDDLASKLRSVSTINQSKRPRWRWL